MSDVVSSPVGVPADLDSIPPGAELAGILECIDLETVSGHDRVTVMRAHQRLVSHYQSRLYADMTAISDAIPDATGVDDVELAWDAASSEIRAALHLTRRAADTELGVAETLRDRLPAVARLLREGMVDPRRARTILHATGHLSSDTARAVVDRIIEVAPRLTTG